MPNEQLKTPSKREQTPDGGLIRVQFEIPEEKMADVRRLCEQTGIKTNKELMSNALALFQWAVREVERGRAIASVDEANTRFKEVWMPVLEHVANRRPSRIEHLIKKD